MFDRSEGEGKFEHFMHERTAANFTDTQDESFVYQVEAEKQYVERLKSQREKIESLYSKYDVLLRDLKTKEHQLKEKDKTISALQTKCKTLANASQESTLLRQQSKEALTENQSLQRAMAELQESYAYLHGQLRSKEAVSSQRLEEVELLNEELMTKLRSLSKKHQERQEQHAQHYQELVIRHEQLKNQTRKQREDHAQQAELLRSALLQKDEQIRLLKTDNQCLRERLKETESYMAESAYEYEQRIEQFQKQRKLQVRALKGETEVLRESHSALEKRWQKAKEELQLKELSLAEVTLLAEQQDKQAAEALSLLKAQFAQEKAVLKQQLLHYENHVAKLQRKIADSVRKEQSLHGKIKKYQVCLDAKRNLREIQKEELDRINLLLNLS